MISGINRWRWLLFIHASQKNGYNSCEITMDTRDKKVLYLVQHMYVGSVKQISNALRKGF